MLTQISTNFQNTFRSIFVYKRQNRWEYFVLTIFKHRGEEKPEITVEVPRTHSYHPRRHPSHHDLWMRAPKSWRMMRHLTTSLTLRMRRTEKTTRAQIRDHWSTGATRRHWQWCDHLVKSTAFFELNLELEGPFREWGLSTIWQEIHWNWTG